MVVAANHVGDAHVHVVHHHAEVVGGRAVGAGDDEVVERGVGNADFAFHQIVPAGNAVNRHFEADDGFYAGGDWGQYFAGFRPPAAVISGRAFALGFFAHCFQFFFAAIAVVGVACIQQLLDEGLVTREVFGLVHDVVAVVGVQADPVHALQDDVHGFLGGAFQIGVFDAQQEFAAVVLGKRPGIQRGAHAADVQVARGAGGETGFNGHDVVLLCGNGKVQAAFCPTESKRVF